MDFGKDDGTGFELVEGKPKEGVLGLRVCSGQALKDIHAKTRKQKAEYKNRQRHEFIVVDEELELELIWDYSIPFWEGIKFAGPGEDKPTKKDCTLENKIFAMRNFPKFVAYYQKFMTILNEELESIREESAKN